MSNLWDVESQQLTILHITPLNPKCQILHELPKTGCNCVNSNHSFGHTKVKPKCNEDQFNWLFVPSQLSAQRACSSVHPCVLGRVEAGSLEGRRAGLGRSSWVTAQTWGPPSKTRGMEYLRGTWVGHSLHCGSEERSSSNMCKSTTQGLNVMTNTIIHRYQG